MNHCSQRLAALGSAVLAIILCAACTADPPPSVAGVLSPSLQSTLQEMTDLGARENSEQSYAYTLTNNCNLHATRFLNGQPTKQMVFSLVDTQFGRYDYAPSLGYAVRTVNQGAGIDNAVFEAHSLELVQSMLQLLEKIKAECVGSSVLKDHGKQTN